MKTRYVLGFCFDKHMNKVALIQKQKPAWQKGLFNGIGGKIELSDDSDIEAMEREFQEEAGIFIDGWTHFAKMIGDDWEVECFYVCVDSRDFSQIQTQEEEEIYKIYVHHLWKTEVVSNLQWLIPLAIDMENINYSVTVD